MRIHYTDTFKERGLIDNFCPSYNGSVKENPNLQVAIQVVENLCETSNNSILRGLCVALFRAVSS